MLNFFFRFLIGIIGGYFNKDNFVIPQGWFHISLVFHGPHNGQGLKVYHEGGEYSVTTKTSHGVGINKNSSGIVVIGRRLSGINGHHGSVQVDDMIFWNTALTKEEAQLLRNNLLH